MSDMEVKVRPKRNLPSKVKVAPQTLKTGYLDFTAEVVLPGKSGLMDTAASVTVGDGEYQGSSKGIGHAEMDAINQAIEAMQIDNLDDLISIDGKTVTCVGKPVCYRCAIVLGLLGFAQTEQTTKTKSGKGQTQWVLPNPLNELVIKKYGDIVGYLENFPNFDVVR